MRACMCVWARARKPVNTCVWWCVCVCVCVRQCERARAGDYECGVFVFQCASVSLCFVCLSICSDVLLCYCFCVRVFMHSIL